MLTPVMGGVGVTPLLTVGEEWSTPLRPAFLIDVQAHTLWVERAPGDDNSGDGQPDFTYKREGGQLLLLRVPGA
jgi:hypothetical protein